MEMQEWNMPAEQMERFMECVYSAVVDAGCIADYLTKTVQSLDWCTIK